MNKRIDLSNLGGFPLEEDTLDFMQQSYRGAFGAMAKLCGDKVIVSGVVVAGANVSDGWIVYNGELIPFTGGVLSTDVVITETPAATQSLFEDGTLRDVYYTKIATCGILGNFPFADLVPLLSLQNIWRPGDIKQRYCDNAYIAANFDIGGYGLGVEKGWQILSAAYPNAAGKVLVNIDVADAEFDTAGKFGGEKTEVLDKQHLPAINIVGKNGNLPIIAGDYGMLRKSIGGSATTPTDADSLGSGTQPDVINMFPFPNLGSGVAHNNLQPYFVVLTLIKL